MKLLLALGLSIGLSTAAFAAGPDEPVKAIMDLATQLWSDNPPADKDYFDKDHIGLFSKEFVTLYRDVEKYPIYEGGSNPFGYDVVTSSQDGCPLKDVSIAPGPETSGTTDVKVTFKLMSCYPDDPGRDAVSEVHFKVVSQDGKPVIADIDRIVEGKPVSLVTEMKEIVKTGQEAPTPQPETQE
jgi:hypothetical protein